MKTFVELNNNPPKLSVKNNANEIIINLVSCMCDNRYKWRIKKDSEGNYKINTLQYSFSNFQTKYDRIDIEWTCDENNWLEVFKMINSGTSRIESVKSR